MEILIDFFTHAFLRNALIVGILIAVCASLLGVILVLKRYSMIGHALGDVGFASISLAIALGLPQMSVSMPIVITASFLIMFLSQRGNNKGDVVIGMVATGSLSAGIIITYIAGGFNTDVYNYMFGSILAVNNSDVILSIFLSVLIIIIFIIFYNRLFLITYDETYARACGINVTLYQFLVSFLTSLTVVIGMRMMGTLLISSLIIFPAISARQIVKSFKAMIILSAVISACCFLIGMVLSYLFGIPTGASIVAVNIAVSAVSFAFNKILKLN